ncbi:hypothetical protein [Saccharibacillus sacchari]|uniref:Uncharacterized protein n=1 Tax=Saccharibacillus sacchari TaxID=456493 RepID=A0ACC6P730_9BACL
MIFKRLLLLALIVLLGVLVACGEDTMRHADSQPDSIEMTTEHTGKAIVQATSFMIEMEKNQLVRDSDTIIHGIVLSQETENDFTGLPATDTFVQVLTVYKGNPGEIAEVRTEGGETDDKILLVDEKATPMFTVGEEVVLFLSSNKGSRLDKEDFDYGVLGLANGKFTVEPDSDGIIENQWGSHRFDFDHMQHEIDELERYNELHNVPSLFLPEGEESDI